MINERVDKRGQSKNPVGIYLGVFIAEFLKIFMYSLIAAFLFVSLNS